MSFYTRTALLLLITLSLSACDRGSWWYRHPNGDPYGIQEVVINGTTQTKAQMLDGFRDCMIQRVYGSYGPLSDVSSGVTNNAHQVAMFNVELHNRGIISEYLISEDWEILEDIPSLLSRIENRVLMFNDTPAPWPGTEFDALHLDIEPQQAPVCKLEQLDRVQCYDLFAALIPLLAKVQILKQSYDSEIPVYVDLPVWVDKYGDSAKLAWPEPAEDSRDTWFLDLADYVDGITLMAYGEDDEIDLWNSVEWEVSHFSKPVRVALKLDPDGGTFVDWVTMNTMALWLEFDKRVQVDFHSVNEIQAKGGCRVSWTWPE